MVFLLFFISLGYGCPYFTLLILQHYKVSILHNKKSSSYDWKSVKNDVIQRHTHTKFSDAPISISRILFLVKIVSATIWGFTVPWLKKDFRISWIKTINLSYLHGCIGNMKIFNTYISGCQQFHFGYPRSKSLMACQNI